MRKNIFLRSVIFAFLLFILCRANFFPFNATSSQLDELVPNSVMDLSKILNTRHYSPNSQRNFYSIQKHFVKPGAELLGEKVPLAKNGYTVQITIWHMVQETSITNYSDVKKKVSAGAKNYEVSPSFIELEGYAVAVTDQGRKVILTGRKGKYDISVWGHYRGQAKKSKALSYVKYAMSYILRRISVGSVSGATSEREMRRPSTGRSLRPTLGPASVTMQLEPQRVEVIAGQRPHLTVHIINDGQRRITGLKLNIPRIGNLSLRKTSLQPGESISYRNMELLPAERGLSGYQLRVTCNEGAYSARTVLINGLERGERGPAPETIPPEQIHRLLPDTILDAEVTEVQDRRDWGMFTRRYGTTSHFQSVLVTINKNYNISEEMTPQSYERMIQQNMSQLRQSGSTIKRFDNYPVILGVNNPGYHITGGFWFSWFECDIQCMGRYAEMKYFDCLVRSVLANLGYASPPLDEPKEEIEPPKLSLKEISPDSVELSESKNVPFKVTVRNYGYGLAENVTVTFVDSNDDIIGFVRLGSLGADEEKTIDASAEIEISSKHLNRTITVEVSCPKAEAVKDTIEVVGRRPAAVDISIEPDEVVISPKGVSEYNFTLQNKGDMPSDGFVLQIALEETDYISKELKIRMEGNETEQIDWEGQEIAWLIEKYFGDNRDFPPAGEVKYIIRKEGGGQIIDEAYIYFSYSDEFRSKLIMEINDKDVAFDLTPKEEEEWEEEEWEEDPWEEEEWEEDPWEEEEPVLEKPWVVEPLEDKFHVLDRTVYIGTPFDIVLENKGVVAAKNVRLEIRNRDKEVLISRNIPNIPRICLKDDSPCIEDRIPRFPYDEEFLSLVSVNEGTNSYIVVLKEDDQEIAREVVYLNVKGISPKEKLPKLTLPKVAPQWQKTVDVDGIFYKVKDYGNDLIIVFESSTEPVFDKDKAYKAAWTAWVYRNYISSDLVKKDTQKLLEDMKSFLKLQVLAEISLSIRDAATAAIVKVGSFHLQGIKLTKDLAIKVTKQLLVDTIEATLTDPISYLRAIVKTMLVQNIADLENMLSHMELLSNLEIAVLDYETAVNLVTTNASVGIYTTPLHELTNALNPDASIKAQLMDTAKNFYNSIFDEIDSWTGGSISAIQKIQTMEKVVSIIDNILRTAIPAYAKYQDAVEKRREQAKRSQDSIKKYINNSLNLGIEFMTGKEKIL